LTLRRLSAGQKNLTKSDSHVEDTGPLVDAVLQKLIGQVAVTRVRAQKVERISGP
jgi:hypothetical protein